MFCNIVHNFPRYVVDKGADTSPLNFAAHAADNPAVNADVAVMRSNRSRTPFSRVLGGLFKARLA